MTERVNIEEHLTVKEFLQELPYRVKSTVVDTYLKRVKGFTPEQVNFWWSCHYRESPFPPLTVVAYTDEAKQTIREYHKSVGYTPSPGDMNLDAIFIFHGEIAQARGHCVLQDMNTDRMYSMVHSCDLRLATDEEL